MNNYLYSLEAAVDEVPVKDILVRLRGETVLVDQVDHVRQLPVEVTDLGYSFLILKKKNTHARTDKTRTKRSLENTKKKQDIKTSHWREQNWRVEQSTQDTTRQEGKKLRDTNNKQNPQYCCYSKHVPISWHRGSAKRFHFYIQAILSRFFRKMDHDNQQHSPQWSCLRECLAAPCWRWAALLGACTRPGALFVPSWCSATKQQNRWKKMKQSEAPAAANNKTTKRASEGCRVAGWVHGLMGWLQGRCLDGLVGGGRAMQNFGNGSGWWTFLGPTITDAALRTR